ncbi:POLRMT family protein [Megaselia abdita]
MYRILSTPSLTLKSIKFCVCQSKTPSLLHPLQTSLPAPTNYPLTRLQSSGGPVTEQEPKKKKRFQKPKYSKYVELLEVTETTSRHKRARVKMMKANEVQDFIAKAILAKRAREEAKVNRYEKKESSDIEVFSEKDLDLSKSSVPSFLYDDKPVIFCENELVSNKLVMSAQDINRILKSFNNFKEAIETIEHGDVETLTGLMDIDHQEHKPEAGEEEITLSKVTEEKLADLEKSLDSPLVNTRTSSKSKAKFKSKTHHSAEQERLSKEKSLSINLATYLNVCVSAGMTNRGLSTLIAYRLKTKSQPLSSLINIKLYNILLHGFAELGDFEKIHTILKCCREDHIALNHQSYAAILEAIGREEPNPENTNKLKEYLDKAVANGVSPNDIMDLSKFHSDQREMVLDSIKRVIPDFVPEYSPPKLTYDNSLLNSLNKNVLPANDKRSPSRGTDVMKSKLGFSKETLQEWSRDQLKIELEGYVTVKSIEKPKEDSPNFEAHRMKFEELQNLWRSQIINALNRDLNTLRAQSRFKPQGYMTYYSYLKTLDVPHYADIVLREIRHLAEGSETYSPTVGQLYKELGQKVHTKYLIEQSKKNGVLEKVGDIYSEYVGFLESGKTSDNPRQLWQRLVHVHRTSGPSMDINAPIWPNNVLLGVGRFLYNIIMRDIKIDSNILRTTKSKPNLLPAFYTLFRNHGKLVKEEVKPHPVLARLLRSSKQQTLTFESNLVPMLCPPQPWSTPVNGGYLLNRSELIRLPHQAVQQWSKINNQAADKMYPPLDSLNQLSSIPWRVNTDILDVIISVFQKGGDDKLDVPQSPSTLPALPKVPSPDPNVSNTERALLFKAKMAHRRKQAEMYSLWCDTLYRLSLANHYRDKTFWLPHNMDFRGRVYPIPPHLNHLGSDLARSLLIFDKARPLGVDGFMWLKLHCINLTGLKKRDSVRERLLYAEEAMDDILDSADNPLTGRKWWVKSDEPWQTLACCVEIAKVKRSGDPENFMSRFPIHQDGSCNGLQHYAALGRDKSGAMSVNLSPAPIPQDVYSAVAALVEKTRQEDAANGIEVAKILSTYVRRKVIKQTVMTTVYGVTRYGARLQIARQLKDIDEFPKEWVWPASTYLTSKTFESLREMFNSTREIQDWFTECARLISGVCGKNVEWMTPLGLPVVQPYNRIDKSGGSKNYKINQSFAMDMYEKPNIMKQKNAFPPNFIHSLDSSHMMLTSLHCERKGITFVSVHDCFWTHACSVPDMNKICREQFVALHSQPILEDLSEFMIQNYSSTSTCSVIPTLDTISKTKLDNVLKSLPEKGDFDLKNVLKSIYFFS